ncbi:MAG TPA: type II secretion system F family protein [Phycisphaerae bacterium]|nr:type II secretion system F family protein [Phycisphaerales bacterium]HRX83810.1 type II secretion system F family protein [Phycisphaerae bacterium]
MTPATRLAHPPRSRGPAANRGHAGAREAAGAREDGHKPVRAGSEFNPQTIRIPVSQLVLFTRQMAMLLTSGSGLVPALAAIGPQMRHERHKRMLEAIRTDLEEGSTLTEALGRFPRAFDASYCAVVAAGESSARLPQMFNRLAVIIGKRRAMRNKIVGSLIYPALLILLSIKIMAVMLFFVIPRFAGMFDTLGVKVPASTQMLMSLATFLRSYWYLAVLMVAGVIGLTVYLLRSRQGRQFLANMQTRIPVAGRLASRLIQGQTFRILGMLLEARVGLLEALELASGVTRNDQFQNLYASLREAVTRGDSISGALDAGKLINPSIVQAVRTGEQSGRLGEAVSFAADILDEENTELLGTATKLIEPMVLIVMGAIVGTVAVSLFMPLFDMTSAI